jgi:hypothetical protein
MWGDDMRRPNILCNSDFVAICEKLCPDFPGEDELDAVVRMSLLGDG